MNNAAVTHPSAFRPPPTSFSLRESLVLLNVCRERDFRRCRRRVRRLARGIPAFDFVWIDALLHAGFLTSFQAKVLETSLPDRLRIGPCVLLDRLGHGEFSETYLARTHGDLDRVVLKRLRPPAEMAGPALERLRVLIERLRGLDNPFLVGPHFTDQNAGDLIVLSRHVAGPNCRELLVRRGRFPVDVVAQIARQLAAGLAALESRACLHGQIQLPNIRLTAGGQAVLVDAGIGGALERGLLLRSDVPPENYEGTAPELIGTGNFQTTATELYAFGCALWQLLAGRPPFPTGDPLGKLAAHQSRAVPEIREFAPDTPAPLAEALRALTQRDPGRRPATFAEVTARFGNANSTGHRRLLRFRREFDTAAPLDRTPVERDSRLPAAAVLTVLLVLAGAALTLVDGGATSRLNRLRSAASTFLSEVSIRAPKTPHAPADDHRHSRHGPADGLRPLPAPDAEGVVLLSTGPYEAEPISYVGDLTVRGTGGSASLIVVRDRPFEVVCRKFTLDHVIVRRETSATRGPAIHPSAGDSNGSLLSVRSQEVFLERCAFGGDKPAEDRGAAVVWSGVNARDPDAGRIRLSNALFFNAGAAVVCATPPGRLEVDNCLKVGGALFDLRAWPTVRDIALSARHLTLRRATALCRARVSKTTGHQAQLRVALDECVFDLAGPQAGLLRLSSEKAPAGHDLPFVVTGGGSVIRPDVPVVAWTNPAASGRTATDLPNAVVEGLAVGEFQFLGTSALTARDSAVDGRSLQIPRRSNVPPGIVAERLTFILPLSPVEARAEKLHGPRPVAN
jgi:eukaryotic-like serine/threonine-protein kinase